MHSVIHTWFEEQSRQTPDSVAVVFEGQQLSYGELNARANQLARHLLELGVSSETLVGLCVERSLEMVIGILGVLKAGAAYVPLDPAYPPERLSFMLQDAATPVLVTQAHLDVPDSSAVRVLLDSSGWPLIATHSRNDLTRANGEELSSPERLAYVIYTSGSTGRPKGVMISHANVTRLFTATKQWFEFKESDIWTLFHSYAFDFSVWELFGALLHGGRLVVVPSEVSRSSSTFYRLMCRECVTVLNQTPTAFYQLMHAEQEDGVSPSLALRWLIFGGESLDFSRLRTWFEAHGDQCPQLVNMYGITETTVHVTYQPVTRELVETAASGSLIGQPIPDLEIHVLDENMAPVSKGESGELYVGGAGLARAYWNRRDLTAERFVKHPFRPEPGSRLYKTGDLARCGADGTLVYLGRQDFQVQLRGFRIELSEIEATLLRDSSLREAIVILREDVPGDKRLVAYLVTRSGRPPNDQQLRHRLRETVPDYMVPAAFVHLQSLPLSLNGKVDRRALPLPSESRPKIGSAFVPPRTPLEEVVAGFWSEVLSIEQVGVHDSFFDLGGHSLLATRVLSRIRRQFQVEVSLRSFFDAPTVADVASSVFELLTARIQSDGTIENVQPC